MKRFLKWTLGIAGAAVGTVFAVRAVQAARQRLKQTLADAEAVADRTRATVEQTQRTLHEFRTAI
jgi:hypothetical protein